MQPAWTGLFIRHMKRSPFGNPGLNRFYLLREPAHRGPKWPTGARKVAGICNSTPHTRLFHQGKSASVAEYIDTAAYRTVMDAGPMMPYNYAA